MRGILQHVTDKIKGWIGWSSSLGLVQMGELLSVSANVGTDPPHSKYYRNFEYTTVPYFAKYIDAGRLFIRDIQEIDEERLVQQMVREKSEVVCMTTRDDDGAVSDTYDDGTVKNGGAELTMEIDIDITLNSYQKKKLKEIRKRTMDQLAKDQLALTHDQLAKL